MKITLLQLLLHNGYSPIRKTILDACDRVAHVMLFFAHPQLGRHVDSALANSRLCELAATHNYLDVLKWMHSNGFDLYRSMMVLAARQGNIAVLDWADEQGCRWGETVHYEAAFNGNTNVLKWAYAKNPRVQKDNLVCVYAAEHNHFDVLKLAYANGHWLSAEVCAAAALNGNLAMLKWAHKRGCPWDRRTCLYAAEYGHNEVLEWARKRGCPE